MAQLVSIVTPYFNDAQYIDELAEHSRSDLQGLGVGHC